MRTLTLVALLAALLVACDGTEPAASSPLDRDAFVETWVDLRTTAIASPGRELDPARRDAILDAHGVTEEDLLGFVEAHGRDVDYMKEVWTEVEARMDSLPVPPDSAG